MITRINNKKSQGGVFGLSFSMIISIILIVFFIVSAGIGINAFLKYQRCAQLGMFLNDLQAKIDSAWNSESSSFKFNSTLISGIKQICFVNLTAENYKNANPIEKDIWKYIQENEPVSDKNNLYIYAPDKDLCIKWHTLKHIDLSGRNPICIPVLKNVVSIKIERNFNNPLVSLSI